MGALTNMIANVRLYVDKPSANAKFSDTQILGMIRENWAEVVREVNMNSQSKVRVRYPVTVVADRREYILPPTVGQIIAFEKRDDDGNLLWEEVPRGYLHPCGPGFTIEGNILRFDPIWREGESLELVYVPNGEVPPHDGVGVPVIQSTDYTGTTLNTIYRMKLDTTPSTGSLDTRPNAYAGYMLRILTNQTGAGLNRWGQDTGYITLPMVQERPITSSEQSGTGDIVVNFAPSLDPLPGWTSASPPTIVTADTTTMTYEVIPLWMFLVEKAVTLKVARFIASVTSDEGKRNALNGEYMSTLRTIRMEENNKQARIARTFPRADRRFL